MSAFDVFYSAYPRKIGKRAAELAFARSVKRGNEPGDLIAAANRFRDDPERKRKGIEFTPHPATWLNQDRHLDQPPPPTQKTLFLGELEEVDDRPPCCIEASTDDYGFKHWLEAHATPEEVEKAHRFGIAKRLGASA